jgi:adenylate cyclase
MADGFCHRLGSSARRGKRPRLEARVAEQVEELGRVGRLKRFLAPQLAELIVPQGDEKMLESHRREIVVVFCDLRGYTAFTETAEPEEFLDFLREYHGALGPLVSQFEGTLDQFSGDGIMVFFNDPVLCRPRRARGQDGDGAARRGGHIDRQLAPTWPTARVWCWDSPGLRDARSESGALTLKGLTQPVVAYNVPLAAIQPTLRVIEGGPQSV